MRRPCSITSLVQEGSPPAVAEDPQRLLPRACGHRCGVQLAASCGQIRRVADPPITRHLSEKKPSWFRTTVDFKSTPREIPRLIGEGCSVAALCRRLLRSVLAFADDRLVAQLQIALDDFRAGAVVETELDRDRCWLSIAQDPDL